MEVVLRLQLPWRQRLSGAFRTPRGRIFLPLFAGAGAVLVGTVMSLGDRESPEAWGALVFLAAYLAYATSALLQLSPALSWAKSRRELVFSSTQVVEVSLAGERRDLGWAWVLSASDDDEWMMIAFDAGPAAKIALRKQNLAPALVESLRTMLLEHGKLAR